jgi:hypothetical protein
LLAVEQKQRREDTGNGHQRSDREIDPACGNHEGHSDRDDDDRRDLRQICVQCACGEKVRGEYDVVDNQPC